MHPAAMSIATPAPDPVVPRLDIDPFGDQFLANPYAHHELLRAAGPVFWLNRYQIYGSARYEAVAAALLDHETYCSGRGVGLADFAREEPWRPASLLLEADPPAHSSARTLMNRVAALGGLKKLWAVWLAEARKLVGELVEKRRFDAVGDLAEVYPLRVFPDLIGLPAEGRENLIPYGAMAFNSFGPRNAHYEVSASRVAAGPLQWVAYACKRENLLPGGWGMDVFHAADQGLCTQDDAERLVRSFLTAGLDTTMNGLAHLILALAQHPDQYALLRENPEVFVKRTFEESLRWDSTVQTFFRTTTRDTEIDGVPVAKGQKIILFLGAANRDPRRWEEPDAFDIRRQSSGHVGFGFGIHQCLGQMVARQEATALLTALVERVAEIHIVSPPKRRINNTLHALASLDIEITPG